MVLSMTKIYDKLEGPGLSHTGSSVIFHGNVFGQDASMLQLGSGKTQEIHEQMSYCIDMTEIMLKAELNTIHSFSIIGNSY